MGKNKSILLLDEILQEVFKIDGHKSKFYFYKKDTVLFKDLENQQKIFFAPMDKNIKNKKKSQGNATIAHIIDACQQEPPENTEEKKLQEIIDIFKNNHKWIWEGGKYNVDFNIFDECNIKDDAKNRSDICLKCFEKRYNKCLIRVICNFLTDYELKTKDPIIPPKIKKQVNEIYDKIQQCKETFTNEPLSYGPICEDTEIIERYVSDLYCKIESYFKIELHIENCLKISDYTYKNLAYIKWYIAHLKIWMGIKKREGMFLENNTKDKEQIYELLCSASTIIKKLIRNKEEITDIAIDFVRTESDKLMAYLICKDSGISIEESDKPDIDYIENRAKNLKNNRMKAEIYLSLWYYSKEEKSNEDTEKYRKKFRAICQEKNDTLELEMLNLEYLIYQYIDICKGAVQSQKDREGVERTIENLLEKILKMDDVDDVAKSEYKDAFWNIFRSIEESEKLNIDDIENIAKNLHDNRMKAEIYLSLWYYSKKEKSNENADKYKKKFGEICIEKYNTSELEMLNLDDLVHQYIYICKGANQNQKNREGVERTIENLLEEILKMDDIAKSEYKDTFRAICHLFYSHKREYYGRTLLFSASPNSINPIEQFMGCPDEYRRIMGIEGFFSITHNNPVPIPCGDKESESYKAYKILPDAFGLSPGVRLAPQEQETISPIKELKNDETRG